MTQQVFNGQNHWNNTGGQRFFKGVSIFPGCEFPCKLLCTIPALNICIESIGRMYEVSVRFTYIIQSSIGYLECYIAATTILCTKSNIYAVEASHTHLSH
jgi:hypothetical protein